MKRPTRKIVNNELATTARTSQRSSAVIVHSYAHMPLAHQRLPAFPPSLHLTINLIRHDERGQTRLVLHELVIPFLQVLIGDLARHVEHQEAGVRGSRGDFGRNSNVEAAQYLPLGV